MRSLQSDSIQKLVKNNSFNLNPFFKSAGLNYFGSFILKVDTLKLLNLGIIYFDRNNIQTEPYFLCEELIFVGVDLLKSKSSSKKEDYVVVRHHIGPPSSKVINLNDQIAISQFGARINTNPIYLQNEISELPEDSKIQSTSKLDYKWYVTAPDDLKIFNSFEDWKSKK